MIGVLGAVLFLGSQNQRKETFVLNHSLSPIFLVLINYVRTSHLPLATLVIGRN